MRSVLFLRSVPAAARRLSPRGSAQFSTTAVAAARAASAVNSFNEWGRLTDVVVGRCEGSTIPANEPAFMAKVPKSKHIFDMEGPRSHDAVQRGNEELENLVSVLEGLGTRVRRPEGFDFNHPVQTPDFSIPYGNTSAMVRDVLLTVGNEIIEAPMSWRSRFFEYRAYRRMLNELFEEDDQWLWTAAPKPTMADSMYNLDYPVDPTKDASPERRRLIEGRVYCTNEAEPHFDAADVMRFGKDIFVNNSYTTNRKGYEWLKRHLAPKGFRVHFFDFPQDYAPMHVDTNFVPLNGSTVMLNPERMPRPWVQRLLKENGWDTIIGVVSGQPIPEMSQCSEWLALNILSVDEKTVLVEESEVPLMERLDKHGFTCIPVPIQGLAEFGGGLHCSTTDIRRESCMESYFPHIDELEAKGEDVHFAPFLDESPPAYACDDESATVGFA